MKILCFWNGYLYKTIHLLHVMMEQQQSTTDILKASYQNPRKCWSTWREVAFVFHMYRDLTVRSAVKITRTFALQEQTHISTWITMDNLVNLTHSSTLLSMILRRVLQFNKERITFVYFDHSICSLLQQWLLHWNQKCFRTNPKFWISWSLHFHCSCGWFDQKYVDNTSGTSCF